MLLVQLAHKPPVPATLLGFCVGGIISYRLNRQHTFKSSKRHREAVWRFAAVAGVGFVATALLMTLAVDWRPPALSAGPGRGDGDCHRVELRRQPLVDLRRASTTDR